MPDEPLDAYPTAKPGESTFTLQGGDPLAAPLVRLWAQLARIQAGVKYSFVVNEDVLSIAQRATPETDAEKEELLLRATSAEELSWDMDNYRAGRREEPETASENLPVPERIDLFDLRTFAASRVSNAIAELKEIAERLKAAGFENRAAFDFLSANFYNLKRLYNELQPRHDRLLSRETLHESILDVREEQAGK